jgi:hypothetical protein
MTAMMEFYLYLAVMPIVAYLVTARRSGVWKGRQIIWPTVRTALWVPRYSSQSVCGNCGGGILRPARYMSS